MADDQLCADAPPQSGPQFGAGDEEIVIAHAHSPGEARQVIAQMPPHASCAADIAGRCRRAKSTGSISPWRAAAAETTSETSVISRSNMATNIADVTSGGAESPGSGAPGRPTSQ